ncbi:unnamed protein product, partial [Discosporangium mesarthrocarpum]
RSKFQRSVTLSSSKAEWTTMAEGVCHYKIIRGILAEMGIPQAATGWYGNNRGALQVAAITGFNDQTKNVVIKLKCTKEYNACSFIDIQFVHTAKQLADIFTRVCASLKH